MKLSTLYTSSNLPYVRLSDTKSSGTVGTTYTSGAYRTITLNTEEQDDDGVCSLSSNQFKLSAGKYAVRISASENDSATAICVVRLRNNSDGATILKWPKFYYYVTNAARNTMIPTFEGRFSIGSNKNLALQIDVSATLSFTATSDGENEVYWVVELVKLD